MTNFIIVLLGVTAAVANTVVLGSVPLMSTDGPLFWGWAGPHRLEIAVGISLGIATVAGVAAFPLRQNRGALFSVSAVHVLVAVYLRWTIETFILPA